MRYKDWFWEQDLNSSVGYDVLCKRMKEGRHLCSDLKEYFKQRCKIEKQYFSDLQKLSESSKFKTELGGLELAWKQLKIETEKIAQAHERSAQSFDKLSTELASFIEEQKRQTKIQEDTVQKAHNSLKSFYTKTKSQEKTFHKKCEEWDDLKNQVKFNDKSTNAQMSTKDFDKLKIKEAKAKEDKDKNDNQYKGMIDEVQRAKQSWEKDMETLCETFQTLDQKRIDHIRDMLWKCTNIDSQMCVDHDECADQVRIVLEKCDIDKDITTFVNMYKVGNVKPAPVQYCPYGRLGSSVHIARSNPPNRPLPTPKLDADNMYSEINIHGKR